jgi:hypothetical protein
MFPAEAAAVVVITFVKVLVLTLATVEVLVIMDEFVAKLVDVNVTV